jgi:hypothetical protein
VVRVCGACNVHVLCVCMCRNTCLPCLLMHTFRLVREVIMPTPEVGVSDTVSRRANADAIGVAVSGITAVGGIVRAILT